MLGTAPLPARWIVRELLVSLIGYRLGLRRLLGRDRVYNVHGAIAADVAEKGAARLNWIKASLRHAWGEEAFARWWPPRRVVELGPGGTLLLGVFLLSEGVQEYVGVDAFESQVWSDYPLACYEAAAAQLPQTHRLRAAVAASRAGDGQGPLRYVVADGGDAYRHLPTGSVDLVMSFDVLEHVARPWRVFQSDVRLLRQSGGVALHHIGCSPHTWNQFGNPWVFLAVPDWLWRLLYAGRAGALNRYVAPDYLRWAQATGGRVDVLERTIADARHHGIHPRLLPRYRRLAAADVFTDSLALAITPGAGPAAG